jgi:hypothetical protein
MYAVIMPADRSVREQGLRAINSGNLPDVGLK